jgi:pyruvate/2-oxoacid:ferredoxin oxidoreductase beta subunit/Pyruvate/2-oxoacid:ferredoxin oxidoreductase gamma subunit
MDSLLNRSRPVVFCSGCSHDNVLKSLDQAFQNMGLAGNEIAIVSDIGCSGLFDTFFNTHALHGLHGRALTYAAGIKLAQPDLNVVVTMGDGGVGIGGAHLLAACRRNLDLTLLVLNNFNFGMTGGQYSATTPTDAQVGSAFLNRLEPPLDVRGIVSAAGAPFVARCSTYQKDLSEIIERAIRYRGFAVVEMLGICPGRYTRRNKLTPRMIEEQLGGEEQRWGEVSDNRRSEYGEVYRGETAGVAPPEAPLALEATLQAPSAEPHGVVILGSAGQRVVTAGEILALAGMTAGLNVTQKNEYNITVLRGPSIAELILSPKPIDYTGIERPTVVLALAAEGVERRKAIFAGLDQGALVLRTEGVEIPEVGAEVLTIDWKSLGIKGVDTALAGLGALARVGRAVTPEMLDRALESRFQGKALDGAREVVARVTI